MKKPLDLVGKKFSRLLVLERLPSSVHGRTRWLCRCDCSATKATVGSSLITGKVKSCGCLNRELKAERCRSRAKHNGSNRPEYGVWVGMHRRCDDPSRDSYHHYGGRGIKVCERWQAFENFYADMGSRPSPQHSIERLDGERDYEPSNCEWATATVQANNRRSSHMVNYRGNRMTLISAVRAAGSIVGKATVWRRIVIHGWSVERAVETPPKAQQQAA